MDKYLDSSLSPEERAEDLLSKMSLEEMLGQVRGYMPRSMKDNGELQKTHPHGVSQISMLLARMCDSADEVAEIQRDLQTKAMAASEHHIPAIFHMEGLCGAQITGDLSLPSGLMRGASFDPELEERLGRVVSRQELSCGITQILAPVLDVTRDSRMGRQNESEGEDPTLIAALGCAYTKGIQETETGGRRADACAKHFIGFHDVAGGIHGGASICPDRELKEIYGKPFQAAIVKSRLHGVMPCYDSINGEAVHGSKKLLTGLLRDEMGFDGQVISDYSGVANMHRSQHQCESDEAAGCRALSAGMDVELPDMDTMGEAFAQLFRSGSADQEILERSVRRVLTAKFRMGLFEHPFALTGKELHQAFDLTEEDKELTLQSAREGIVLLKNEGNILPLFEAGIHRILVVGSQAATARGYFGGYTHYSMTEGLLATIQTMAGVDHGDRQNEVTELIPGTGIQRSDHDPRFEALLQKQKPGIRSFLEELRERRKDAEIDDAFGYHFAGDDTSHFDEAMEKAKEADLVIMMLGGKNGTSMIASMGEGIDAVNINLPPAQEELIRKIGETGKKIIGIHVDGRPISSDAADKYCSAILECFNPSEAGSEAIVDVLTGKVNPSGKMPVSVARCAGQIPVYYNHPNGASWHQAESIGFQDYVDCSHRPRYDFGYGLSYTTFAYSDPAVSDRNVGPADAVNISLKVRNTGAVAGDETVQLYFSDEYASMVRPVMELAGFQRVHLEKGEEKEITFRMYMSQTAFVDEEDNWKIEAGDILLQLGSSSQDIRLQERIRITDDAWLEGRDRRFRAESRIR